MFNRKDEKRDECMLTGGLAGLGYDWWWHSFTGHNSTTGQEKAFFIEFFVCNPASGGKDPVFGQLPENRKNGIRPSYLMVKAGSWGEDARQLHRFFGWDSFNIQGRALFSIQAGDCHLDETSTKGSVTVSQADASEHPEYMCQDGTMSWCMGQFRPATCFCK